MSSRSAPEDGLGVLAHELRTPLTALIGYAEAMRAQTFGPLPPPYGEHAETIHTAARHLLALVDDLADAAAAETGIWRPSREAFSVGQLAREIVSLFAARAVEKGVSVRLEAPDSLPLAIADRRAVGQILINLLDNALKFTARGGAVRLVLAREGDVLRLAVWDTGGSADPNSGRGIGLRLVRALCAAHQGSLELKPAYGGGTVATAHIVAEA
jgi:signal transduction histidine kinase